MLYSLPDYSASKHLAGLCTDWGERSKDMQSAFLADDRDYMESRLCHYHSGLRAYDIAADPRRYILHAGFFDMNELLDVSPPPGSVYVSASTEPFCDEMRLDEKKLKKWLSHFGLIDTTDQGVDHHHISGHANGEELLDFIRSAGPKLVIPIHTEHAEVFTRELRIECRPPVLGEPVPVV
jgi:ribonuclease J